MIGREKRKERGRERSKAMRKVGRRGCAVLLLLSMTAVLLTGCAENTAKRGGSIFTGDPDALRILVRANSTYEQRLVEQFPDIEFDFYHYGGLNTTMMMEHLLENDDLGDLCFTSLQITNEMARDHLLNLSGYSFCSAYEPSILSQFDVEGDIYQLPGYVTMRNIIYNKDMFDEYGWEEPKNFQEMLDLCRQIRAEAEGVTPIVMGGAAVGYYFTTMTSYSQAEFLYTPEGHKWEADWRTGKAKAKDGFGKGIEMMQELIDAGAFDYEKNLNLWDAGLFQQRMLTGDAAMMFVWGGQTPVAQAIEQHKEFNFGIMPFRNRDGLAFVGTNIPYYVSISRNLGEKENEKKLEQALQIVEWLSTEEGMSAFSTESLSAVFPLKNGKNETVLPVYQEFWDEHLDSIKAPMLYAGYEDILVPAAETIIEAVRGETRLDGLAGHMDDLHAEFLEGGLEEIKAGSFTKNFTHEETVQTIANILHSKGDSDLTLVSSGEYKNGIMNSGGVYARFYEGAVMEDQLTCYLPGVNVTSQMQQMTLSGSTIKSLLENGKHTVLIGREMVQTESDEGGSASTDFEYYWCGMKVKWKGDKIKSAVLDSGEALEDEKEYTVSFARGDYTKETEEEGKPTELPYTAKEVMEEYMAENSPVGPAALLR